MAGQCEANVRQDELDKLAIRELDVVFRYALELCGRTDEAWDLVQEVYLRALRGGSQRSPNRPDRIRVWLLKLVDEVHTSSNGRANEIALDAEAAGLAEEHEPPARLENLDWEQVDSRLQDAITQLQPEYRQVLLLWAVEELKYREIATILRVPIGTVMSRLHRARSILGERLQHLARDSERRRGLTG